HFANQCPHTAQFKQILQRNDQQQPPKKVFIAQQNQLDPEDQEQNYMYYQPNYYQQPQYYNTPPPPATQYLQIEQSPTPKPPDTLGMLAAAVAELTNKVNNLKG
ncbi:14424_t:CDS:1, partial [Entrophospora sp. SA101]